MCYNPYLINMHQCENYQTNTKENSQETLRISNAMILKSIKRRQQLFKTHFLSNDPNKVTYYKTYNSKLNRIKDVAKKEYFQGQFRLNSENLKTTLKLIDIIINRKKGCGQPPITKLIHKNRCYTYFYEST